MGSDPDSFLSRFPSFGSDPDPVFVSDPDPFFVIGSGFVFGYDPDPLFGSDPGLFFGSDLDPLFSFRCEFVFWNQIQIHFSESDPDPFFFS